LSDVIASLSWTSSSADLIAIEASFHCEKQTPSRDNLRRSKFGAEE